VEMCGKFSGLSIVIRVVRLAMLLFISDELFLSIFRYSIFIRSSREARAVFLCLSRVVIFYGTPLFHDLVSCNSGKIFYFDRGWKILNAAYCY